MNEANSEIFIVAKGFFETQQQAVSFKEYDWSIGFQMPIGGVMKDCLLQYDGCARAQLSISIGPELPRNKDERLMLAIERYRQHRGFSGMVGSCENTVYWLMDSCVPTYVPAEQQIYSMLASYAAEYVPITDVIYRLVAQGETTDAVMSTACKLGKAEGSA